MVDIIIIFILAVISGYFFPILGDILSLATIGMGIFYGKRRKDRRLTGLGIVLGLAGFITTGIFAGQIEIYGVSSIQIIIGAVVLALGIIVTLIRKDIRFTIGGVILGVLALLAAGIATSTIFVYGISLPPLLLGIAALLALVGFLVYAIRTKNMRLAGLFGVAIVIGGALFYFSVRKLPSAPLSKKLVPGQTSREAAKGGIVETPDRARAMELYHQGKFVKARPLLEQVINTNPNDYDAMYKLATLYEAIAEGDKAIQTYQRVTRVKPDYYPAYYSLGLITWKYGKDDLAERALKKAVALEPKAAGAHFTLAEVYFRKKQYDKALAEFQQVIKYTPADNASYLAAVHNRIAQVYLAQKKKAEAIKEWRAALELDPGNTEAKTNLDKYSQ